MAEALDEQRERVPPDFHQYPGYLFSHGGGAGDRGSFEKLLPFSGLGQRDVLQGGLLQRPGGRRRGRARGGAFKEVPAGGYEGRRRPGVQAAEVVRE